MVRFFVMICLVLGVLGPWSSHAFAHSGHTQLGTMSITISQSPAAISGRLEYHALAGEVGQQSADFGAMTNNVPNNSVLDLAWQNTGTTPCCCDVGGALCSPGTGMIFDMIWLQPFHTNANRVQPAPSDLSLGVEIAPTLQPPKTTL